MTEHCATCGVEIFKNKRTKKMEELFADIWIDRTGRFGSNNPISHWHDPKPLERPTTWEIKHGMTLEEAAKQ